jgi:ABC-type nitrate/sulfonate/bicarbonate transport system ATPase subunit
MSADATRVRVAEGPVGLSGFEDHYPGTFAGLFVTHSVQEATFLSNRVIVMSSRPGRVIADIAVDFDYPRPPDLRFDPAFNRVAAAVSDALRS